MTLAPLRLSSLAISTWRDTAQAGRGSYGQQVTMPAPKLSVTRYRTSLFRTQATASITGTTSWIGYWTAAREKPCACWFLRRKVGLREVEAIRAPC